MSEDSRFTPPAERRWSELGALMQTRLLNNVWCVKCHQGTTIAHFTGRMEDGDLILEGQCMRCDGPVARVIEGG